MFLGIRIECRFIPELGNSPVFRSHCLIDLSVVNHMLMVLRRWPRKNEYIVALAGSDLSRCASDNLFYGDEIHDYPGIVLRTPFLSQHIFEPLVILREKMGLLCDLELFLASECTSRKVEERPGSSGGGCQSDEISAGELPHADLGHIRDLETLLPQPGRSPAGADVRRSQLTGRKLQLPFWSGKFPFCCKQLKFLVNAGSNGAPLDVCTESRNASEAIAPLLGSGMAGQSNHTAPGKTPPPPPPFPSTPHPFASDHHLTSSPV